VGIREVEGVKKGGVVTDSSFIRLSRDDNLTGSLYAVNTMPSSRQTPLDEIADFSVALSAQAARTGHRATLVLSGEQGWCREAAMTVLNALHLPRLSWFGDPPSGLEIQRVSVARELLGRELDGVVIDAWSGFDAEAFGAVSGSLQAGGMMLLLTPPLAQWCDYADPEHARLAVTPYAPESVSGRFLHHIADSVRECVGVMMIGQGERIPELDKTVGPVWRPIFADDGVTPDQKEAVTAIERVAHGHRRRPLVLTSDRGRGKSAVLGIAAAGLLQRSTKHIVITAPRLSAVSQLFDHAERLLPGAERQRGLITWQGRCIEFVPPDALTLSQHEAELLLVDEAAAIPTPLLERMLSRYARIVFAGTIHGYEGTGRGFALRFQKVLTQRAPGWRLLRMNQPVRWAEGDPLERLGFRALMLDAEAADDKQVAGADTDSCRFELIDRERLIGNRRDLADIFGLLVLAHYRTSPNDLRHLLDGPNVRVYVLRYDGRVVATAVVAEEGGLESNLARMIYEGRRRAHGHLLAQSLAVHAGFAEAPILRAWRVVRIAVHPVLMRRGLGRYLLQQVQHQAIQEGVDYVGASFGADVPLLAFWRDNEWMPVRIGLSREAASGTHSVMVMRALSEAGDSLFRALQRRLAEQLPLLLSEPLAELDAELTVALTGQLPVREILLPTLQDWRDVRSFAEALRGYEVCQPALWRLTPIALADEVMVSRLDEDQRRLLVQKVLQRHDWRTLSVAFGMSGKSEVVAALRTCFREILTYYRETGKLPPQLD
jgi:tRNA(Met) cytidine acetyltransferase